jgi:hypothetical protein
VPAVPGFSARWTGYLTPKTSEPYTLMVWVNDIARVYLDRVLVIDAGWSTRASPPGWVSSSPIAMNVGEFHTLEVDYEGEGGKAIQLKWFSASVPQEVIPTSQLYTTLPPLPPPAPTNLVAQAGDAQVLLTWSASPGALGYALMRGTTPGMESEIGHVDVGSAASAVDTSGLVNGTTYYYVMIAWNAIGQSGPSNEVSATPSAGAPPPPAPPPSAWHLGDFLANLNIPVLKQIGQALQSLRAR